MRRSVSEVWPVGLSGSGAVPARPSSLRRSLSELTEHLAPCAEDDQTPLLPGGGDDGGVSGDDGGVLMSMTSEALPTDPSTAQTAEKLIHLYQVVERLTNKCYVTDR